ncbi:phosphate acyltransferase PlsX [Nonomuraea muscovyensis]|uniref:Phosphate acyltransferase n=1 Tax=Nonomuraea muscovyensis TaxID=1124761 RepID=A0A7X0C3E4_9ACTN|nr:phosphate acyltransferase [Nonomuraea muscovyensis]MBB6347815.1 glycerol-3-phosphate acyltransferase PlsX [Nonomuraea muscovyensis]
MKSGRTAVALDGMGGDQGPGPVMEAALDFPDDVDLMLVGSVPVLREHLGSRPLPGHITLLDAPESVSMADDPLAVTWGRRGSSLLVAAQAVRTGLADAMVTPGNTGAAVLAAAVRLRRVPGVRNPALATVLRGPGAGQTVLLDIGATVVAQPEWLVEFAVMGVQYARARLGVPHPRVGLLSNGHEVTKGGPAQRDAHLMLATLPGYVGQIEAYDVLSDRVDVAVTDGFTGDVMLKTYERTLDLTALAAVSAVRSFSGSLADRRARQVSQAVRDALAADSGGVLLGVRGVCVVCHGAATAHDIAGAVRLAADCVRADVTGGVTAAFAVARRTDRIAG